MRNVVLVIIIFLVTTTSLFLLSTLASTLFPSPQPFLIIATIVTLVALYGTIFSLYLRERARK